MTGIQSCLGHVAQRHSTDSGKWTGQTSTRTPIANQYFVRASDHGLLRVWTKNRAQLCLAVPCPCLHPPLYLCCEAPSGPERTLQDNAIVRVFRRRVALTEQHLAAGQAIRLSRMPFWCSEFSCACACLVVTSSRLCPFAVAAPSRTRKDSIRQCHCESVSTPSSSNRAVV